jgi:hypothetical protein
MKAWKRFLSLLLILPFLFAASHSQEKLYKDGSLENAEIMKQGYGFAYTRFPFKYLEEFRRYEREAMEIQRGLWRINNGRKHH